MLLGPQTLATPKNRVDAAQGASHATAIPSGAAMIRCALMAADRALTRWGTSGSDCRTATPAPLDRVRAFRLTLVAAMMSRHGVRDARRC
jgi:hypothetical protein